jgi:RNA polymerase sigma-70 factor (ECF subfamily)
MNKVDPALYNAHPKSSLPANDGVDVNIIQKMIGGDEHALGELYSRYYKPLFGFMFKITRSREDAEDIVQDVFVRMWNMRARLDAGKNIKALMFVMARRAAVDLYRRTGRTDAVSYTDPSHEGDLSTDISPAEILEDIETKLIIDIAIDGMPAKQREVFTLHYHDNLTPEEIAQRLGLTYDNVRKHIYNGKKQLRDMFAFIFAFIFFGLQQ